jgi:hypothetical protein
VFSLMTSFTHSLRTSFTPEQVKLGLSGGWFEVENRGHERTEGKVCDPSQQRPGGDEGTVPGV